MTLGYQASDSENAYDFFYVFFSIDGKRKKKGWPMGNAGAHSSRTFSLMFTSLLFQIVLNYRTVDFAKLNLLRIYCVVFTTLLILDPRYMKSVIQFLSRSSLHLFCKFPFCMSGFTYYTIILVFANLFFFTNFRRSSRSCLDGCIA